METQFLPLQEGGRATPATYRSHKIVQAVRILEVSAAPVVPPATEAGVVLRLDDNFACYHTDAAMVARYQPVPGDYLMLYPDGYVSISPRQAFEDGYERV